MKKILSLTLLSFLSFSFLYSQNKHIYFTIKKDAIQANKVNIYAKNTSASTITGQLGASKLTLCIALPASLTPVPTIKITSAISGQDFDAIINDTYNDLNVFTWNATGSPANTTFDPNVEVLLASVEFSAGQGSSTVKLASIPAGGTSTFDYCYIAPNGTDEGDYGNPFYSNIVNDPNLSNCNGPNDYTTNCLSTLAVAGVTLPVNWLSFTASLKGSGAVLNWSAEEKNSRNFEITRSLDGTKFTTINQVASKGNGTNSYTYIDEAVTKVKTQGDIFYQLIQVDKDGKRNPSAIRTVRISLPEGGISVSPNPVLNIATVRFNHPKEEKATLLITDANGKVVYQQATQLQKGYNQKDINLSAISKGNYNLSVVSNSANKTIQLVKAGQ